MKGLPGEQKSISFMSNRLNPLSIETNLLVIALASVAFAVMAFSAEDSVFLTDELVSFEKTYSPWRYIPLELWTIIAAIISILFPVTDLVWNYQKPRVRSIFIPYVLVLIFQIFLEIVFRKFGFSGMSVFIGLIFTVYRVIQLTYAWRLVATSKRLIGEKGTWTAAIVIAGLVFWLFNLLFLTLTLIRREPY